MFNFWSNMFKMGRVTAEKLKEAVVKNLITAEEYEQITGEPYSS